MKKRFAYRFNRFEIAGSIGDFGTLIPISIGMILINGLNPMGLFFTAGLFFIFSGIYFNVTTPVQPMKVIGAYAITTAMEPSQIMASSILMGVLLLIIGVTGAMTFIQKYIPKPVVRGVQLSTGVLLMAEGIRFMMGTSRLQGLNHAAEPYLSIQSMGFIPIGIVIGVIGMLLTCFLLENKKIPAALILMTGGVVIGILWGTNNGLNQLEMGFYLPEFLPFPFPGKIDFTFALFTLVLPQIPMTLGNAVIAEYDLSRQYFAQNAKKVTPRALCISMALGNFLSFFFGGMPLCHGAGGLAAHYRFGARTAGSNIIVGLFFIILVVFLGDYMLSIFYLIPISILGVLLLFAGGQLALTIADLETRKELFVTLTILGITIASNLAVGFITGIALYYIFRSKRMNI